MPRPLHRRTVGGLLLPMVLFIAVGLSACAFRPPLPVPPTQTTEAGVASMRSVVIPVSVLLQAAPLGDTPSEPIYTLITDLKAWDELAGRIPQSAWDVGRQAAAAGQVVILAFAGEKGSSGYRVDIPQVQLQAEQLTVTVSVVAPDAQQIVEPASTLPFVLATIPRETLGAVRTCLFEDEQGRALQRLEVIVR
ncbi:MAG: protease complex subunit PrcB family protein [Anaerolineae bacterium]|nr:protease complex subunit PrcB family protein [Thermoflexales bacterium]MDW8406539.1 protease complex subunit PrcB family protein [Anaerolineae bacterium]